MLGRASALLSTCKLLGRNCSLGVLAGQDEEQGNELHEGTDGMAALAQIC